jgi:SWI/SNF-related matrix-associated actin-dependent regulator of chromatin subfamily A-like protein 1
MFGLSSRGALCAHHREWQRSVTVRVADRYHWTYRAEHRASARPASVTIVQLVEPRPNIELRDDPDGGRTVVLAFPYDARIVARVRMIPNRRFDWDRREWSAPASDWSGAAVADILERFPELTTSHEVDDWLRGLSRRWVGYVGTTRHDGRGWWALETVAGRVPDAVLEDAIEYAGRTLVPLTPRAGEALRALGSAHLTPAATRCLEMVEFGHSPPPARLVLGRGVDGERLLLEVMWDPAIGVAFERLQGATRNGLALDPWLVDQLDAFIAQHEVEVAAHAALVLERLRAEHRLAADAVRRSRADRAEPILGTASVLGGELAPYQWAAVRYALEARRTFLADEQGLGKTVEALAALEADGAYPAVVVCPASIKLGWEREARKWLPHRSVAVVHGRAPVPPSGDITILNYEIVAAHRTALVRRHPRALIVDESHYCKNPHAKRTQAVRRLAEAVGPDGLRLALTGTPVLNHPEELIPQLRILGRLDDFGSGARFAREFQSQFSEERLHWHLRRRCFVRRLKADVLPQLPAKRQVVVPIALTNDTEYRLAENDVIAWLRSQPLDLSELDARVSAALRAERLAQLTALQRLAARGKLAAALAWVEDFLASGEPLVLFARHLEIQHAVLHRFPHALHLLGEDSLSEREASIAAFQHGSGPSLIVCATRTAAQGITLTRASNVAFLELEWTPAIHDQAEDRCHRVGQRDAVTAWYLLAADTIDETMATLIQRKREIVSAVTDGRRDPGGGLVEGVVRELRDGRPLRHLRPVAVAGG